ncbi:PAS domain S-box protein [Deinococcus hopiensis]|nr:PAS domain S-box protein [Deinococcus hopiensis]
MTSPNPGEGAHARSTGADLLKRIAEHGAELSLLLNRHHRIVYASPALIRILGYPIGASEGRDVHASVHPQDRPIIAQKLQELLPKHTLDLPRFRARHANGEWVWLIGRVTHLLDEPGVHALLVQLRPYQRRRDAYRDALKEITRTLASTAEVADVVAAVLNAGLRVTQADAGGIYLLSPDRQFLELIGHAGYSTEAADRWARFLVGFGTPVSEAARKKEPVFLSGTDFQKAYPYIHAHHSSAFGSTAVLPLLIGDRLIGAISLSFDRDRHFEEDEREFLLMVADLCAPALDRALLYREKERQQSWDKIVNQNSSDIVTIIDAEAVIRYVSGSVENILGYHADALIGQSVFELVHPEEHRRSQLAISRLVPTGDPMIVVVRFRHQQGHWVWLECVGRDLRNQEHIRGILVNSRDVTARIVAEQAREESIRALAESERNFRRLADNASDLVRQYAPDGRVEYSSPNVRDLLGYTSEEVLSPDPLHIVFEEDRCALQQAFQRRFTPEFEQEKFEYRLKRKDGSLVWVETTFKTVRDPATGEVVAFNGTTRDIEQRKQAEFEVKAQLNRYRKLLEFTVSLEQRVTPLELVEEALYKCLSLTEYDYGYAFSFNAGTISVLVAAGETPPPLATRPQELAQLPFTDSVLSALTRREPHFISEDKAILSPPELLPRPHWRSLCVLPVAQEGDLSVVLVFGTDQSVTTSEETRQLLSNVTARLSHALERSHHIEQLNTSREETLRALGLALEYRDYETKGHTDRVVHFTERLGQAMGFSGDDLDALRWGAFLHDTGKVAIPDSILLKPDKLTPEEWDVIKRHPSIGYEMLHHIPSLPPTTLEVVLHHQERWNGSGYPRGLAGTEIPLAARIFAVVDVYDALTNERPYKKAWTHIEAADQLRKEAGALLDERVVHTFLQLFSAEETFTSDGTDVMHD